MELSSTSSVVESSFFVFGVVQQPLACSAHNGTRFKAQETPWSVRFLTNPQTQKFLLFKLNRQEFLLTSSASTANFRPLRLCKLPHLQSGFLVLQAFSASGKVLTLSTL